MEEENLSSLSISQALWPPAWQKNGKWQKRKTKTKNYYMKRYVREYTYSSWIHGYAKKSWVNYGCQIEIQIVNRNTYFLNCELNLIMNCKIHSIKIWHF
jgi:hypothetical protein